MNTVLIRPSLNFLHFHSVNLVVNLNKMEKMSMRKNFSLKANLNLFLILWNFCDKISASERNFLFNFISYNGKLLERNVKPV